MYDIEPNQQQLNDFQLTYSGKKSKFNILTTIQFVPTSNILRSLLEII